MESTEPHWSPIPTGVALSLFPILPLHPDRLAQGFLNSSSELVYRSSHRHSGETGCVKTQNFGHRIKFINTFVYFWGFFRDMVIAIDKIFECFPHNQKMKLVFTQPGKPESISQIMCRL